MKREDVIIHAENYEEGILDNIDDEVLNISEEIHLMPDTHIGLSVPIGFVGRFKENKIIPNAVGVDIGCGMSFIDIPKKIKFEYNKLWETINRNVPTGFNIHNKNSRHVYHWDRLDDLRFDYDEDKMHRFIHSIGTLGGGNHFIELNSFEKVNRLVVHSGSRHLGHQIAEYYQKIANKQEGGYLSGQDYDNYIHDMTIAMEYAKLNRKRIIEIILSQHYYHTGVPFDYEIESVHHNYFDTKTNIVYKGAIDASLDKRVIIPINMRDGTIMGYGKGNKDWMKAAPHGAGRILSRTQAKKELTVDNMYHEMEGIFSRTLSKKTLDEHPDAYRDLDEILEIIEESVYKIEVGSVLFNFKREWLMEKEIVIIDCDPGIDDAYALLYALADKTLDVRLISTVSGNVNVDVNTENTQRIVALSNKNVPVVKGAAVPLVKKPYYVEHIHGQNGMNNYVYKDDNMVDLLKKDVVQALYDEIMKAKKPVIIAAVGPLTNIALLLKCHPDVKENIKYLSIMGGGLKGGNTTVAAEFNFYADPEAASIVFQSDLEIIMAGLDVTEKTTVSLDFLEKLEKTNKVGKFLSDILSPESSYMKKDKGSLHDVVSLMAISHLDMFSYKKFSVYIETNEGLTRGMSIADQKMNSKPGNVKVILDVDHKRFFDNLLEKISKY